MMKPLLIVPPDGQYTVLQLLVMAAAHLLCRVYKYNRYNVTLKLTGYIL